MNAINIHDAKTHFSRLIGRVENGEELVISRAGQPVARLVPYAGPQAVKPRRLGFMAGAIDVPADFDSMGSDEIERLFI